MLEAKRAIGSDQDREPGEVAASVDHRPIDLGGDMALVHARTGGGDRGTGGSIGDSGGLARVGKLRRGLDHPQLFDDARCVRPSSRKRSLNGLGDAGWQEHVIELDTQASSGEPARAEGHRKDFAGVLGVAEGQVPDVAALLGNRRCLHGPSEEQRRPIERQDEDRDREVAVMVQAREVIHVLRAADEDGIQVTLTEGGPHALPARLELRLVEEFLDAIDRGGWDVQREATSR